MSPETGNPDCEHNWEVYDDPAAYNDGLNCPAVTICSKCGAQQDIRSSNTMSTGPIWYETFMRFYISVLFIIDRITIAPIILVIRFIKDKALSKNEK
jgi:hypothetical protein